VRRVKTQDFSGGDDGKIEINNEIKPLTFFRFITAFMVFLFHCHGHLKVSTNIKFIDNFMAQGAVFMTAFFILSGFVLYYVYSEYDFFQGKNLKNYYIKRLARIYPGYITVTALSFLLINNAGVAQNILLVPMSLFCWQSFFYSSFQYLLNGGMWSISVEMFFYSLFPLIMFLFKKINQHKIKLFFGLYFLSVYPALVQCYFYGTEDLYINPVFRLPEFMMGMLVASVYLQKKKEGKTYKDVSFIFASILLFVLTSALANTNFVNKVRFGGHYTYYNVVIIPLLAFILYRFAMLTNKYVLAFTNNFVSNYLGRVSYAFYLTQFVAINFLGKKYLLDLVHNKLFLLLIVFFINLILAIILYEFVEKKLRYKITKKYAG